MEDGLDMPSDWIINLDKIMVNLHGLCGGGGGLTWRIHVDWCFRTEEEEDGIWTIGMCECVRLGTRLRIRPGERIWKRILCVGASPCDL